MGDFELVSFASDLELARGAATEWLATVEQASRQGLPQFVALSGGRIARHFFSSSAQLAASRAIALNHVHFFWADERCVPPQDPESNFALADKFLLRPLGLPTEKIHRIHGEDPPEPAAQAAAKEICELAPRNRENLPSLDIIFLGMGEDGHVASLFPNAPPDQITSRAVYLAVVAAKPPPHRITLSHAAIRAAREVWVLASGPGKEQAFKDSLKTGGRTPLAEVLKLRARTKIFTDIRI